jgi:drug/metabolite transporter superfamily protein YnfA
MNNTTTISNNTHTNSEIHPLDAAGVVQSIGVFMLAGLFEIGGGWLVWGWLREGWPMWVGFLGFIVLAAYGAVATLQANTSDGIHIFICIHRSLQLFVDARMQIYNTMTLRL